MKQIVFFAILLLSTSTFAMKAEGRWKDAFNIFFTNYIAARTNANSRILGSEAYGRYENLLNKLHEKPVSFRFIFKKSTKVNIVLDENHYEKNRFYLHGTKFSDKDFSDNFDVYKDKDTIVIHQRKGLGINKALHDIYIYSANDLNIETNYGTFYKAAMNIKALVATDSGKSNIKTIQHTDDLPLWRDDGKRAYDNNNKPESNYFINEPELNSIKPIANIEDNSPWVETDIHSEYMNETGLKKKLGQKNSFNNKKDPPKRILLTLTRCHYTGPELEKVVKAAYSDLHGIDITDVDDEIEIRINLVKSIIIDDTDGARPISFNEVTYLSGEFRSTPVSQDISPPTMARGSYNDNEKYQYAAAGLCAGFVLGAGVIGSIYYYCNQK